MSRRASAAALGAVVLVARGAGLLACDTPVHRYALYRWETEPYQLLRPRLKGAAAEIPPQANLQIIETLTAGGESASLVNPQGQALAEGEIEAAELAAIASSPARSRIAQLIDEGHDGVLVFIAGADAEATETARAAFDRAIAVAARAGVDEASLSELERQALGRIAKPLRVGRVELGREGTEERWLRRALFAIERLTDEESAKPLVYAIYGRGRALEPFVGAGITLENLLGAIAFINGPCSCEVKAGNPGVDLPLSWDWEATARKIAQRRGRETGNERYFGPGEGDEPGGGKMVWDLSEVVVDETSLAPPAPPPSVPPSSPPPPAPSARGSWNLLVAGAVAVAALAAATFVLLATRRRA